MCEYNREQPMGDLTGYCMVSRQSENWKELLNITTWPGNKDSLIQAVTLTHPQEIKRS